MASPARSERRFQRLRHLVGDLGPRRAGLRLAYLALNRVVTFKVFRAFKVEAGDIRLKEPSPYPGRVMAWREFADRVPAAHRPDPQTLAAREAAGSQCLVLLDGDELAAWAWYGGGLPVGDARLRPTADWVYMEWAFVPPAYRGRKLLLHVSRFGHDHFAAQGRKGYVGVIEAANWRSLRSSLDFGIQVFGSIYVVGLGRRVRAFTSGRCADYGLRLPR
jgi:hypothetical protein